MPTLQFDVVSKIVRIGYFLMQNFKKLSFKIVIKGIVKLKDKADHTEQIFVGLVPRMMAYMMFVATYVYGV